MGRRSSSSTSSAAESTIAAAEALALTEAMQMDPAATARPGRDRAPVVGVPGREFVESSPLGGAWLLCAAAGRRDGAGRVPQPREVQGLP
jgi:hypothetical protein